jgi:hypothetical protein
MGNYFKLKNETKIDAGQTDAFNLITNLEVEADPQQNQIN